MRDKLIINPPFKIRWKEKRVHDSLDVNRFARVNTKVAAHSGAVTHYVSIKWPSKDWRLGFLFGAMAAFGIGVTVGAWMRGLGL